MRFTVWSPDLVEMLDQGQLDHQQRAVVEGIFRAMEPGTYLSEHVGGLSSAVLVLVRAHHVLDGNARLGQPRLQLTRAVLSQTLQQVTAAAPAYNVTSGGADLIIKAQRLLIEIVSAVSSSPVPTPSEKHAFATMIGELVQPAAAAVRDALALLWEGSEISEQVAAKIRGEATVLAVLEGRDGHALQRELQKRLEQGHLRGAATIAGALWPTPKVYRIAVVISGARALYQLDHLLPGAKQWPLVGPGLPSTFSGSPEMRSLVLAARPAGGPAVLVQVSEEAADAQTAINQARRRISETLDQYAAGQRLLDLRLARLSLALDPTSKPFTADIIVGGGKLAKPLTAHWSLPLRPALRMANLARQVEAPVTSTALCWSAIESLGVDAHDIETVAKVCALHTIRQQILSVYQSVANSTNARIRHAQWKVKMVAAQLGKMERGHAKATRGQSRAARQASVRLNREVEELRVAQKTVDAQYQRISSQLTPCIEIVRRQLLNGGDSSHSLNMSSWQLEDLNEFVDALLPLRNRATVDQADLQAAMTTMAQNAGGLAFQLFAIWQERLANPSALSSWLDQQQEFFQGLLSWMYTSRNLAFHAGHFAAPSDVLTAEVSQGLVDMILEILGNWHQDEGERTGLHSQASDILIQLAHRKDALVQALGIASSCHPLNVSQITALGGDCWGRC